MSRMFKWTSILILLLFNGMVVAKNKQAIKIVEPPSPPPVELVLTLPDDELHGDQTVANQPAAPDEQSLTIGQKASKPVNVGCKVDMPNNIYVDSLDKKLQGNCDLSLRY